MNTRLFAAALGAAALPLTPAVAQTDHSQMDHAAPALQTPLPAAPDPMGPMDHSKMDHQMSQTPDDDGCGGDPLCGASISGQRVIHSASGSGTSRLPGAEGMMHGKHIMTGDWMVMLHGYAWATYSDQGGPRGNKQSFVTSMAMAEASRDLSDVTRLQLRAMLSLDPLIGKRGYPNLFATGETANGVPLVDRQHPHDFFMELSARLDHDFGGVTGFVYGGPVAEPALGPSAFMHRRSAKLNPEAPITHHWFDSTHITFGVVTAGVATRTLQLEGSVFKGREPDEERWGIDQLKLDSWSVRATWNPSQRWALSLSHGFLKDAEATHPGENQRRTIAAVSYASTGLAATTAYSIKNSNGDPHSAFLAEANWDVAPRHAVFGRVEVADNDELFFDPDPRADQSFTVGKATLGYAYTLPIGPFGLSLGGSGSVYAKPAALNAVYGKSPKSFTLFAKLSLGQ
jgi:hypothetical protein